MEYLRLSIILSASDLIAIDRKTDLKDLNHARNLGFSQPKELSWTIVTSKFNGTNHNEEIPDLIGGLMKGTEFKNTFLHPRGRDVLQTKFQKLRGMVELLERAKKSTGAGSIDESQECIKIAKGKHFLSLAILVAANCLYDSGSRLTKNFESSEVDILDDAEKTDTTNDGRSEIMSLNSNSVELGTPLGDRRKKQKTMIIKKEDDEQVISRSIDKLVNVIQEGNVEKEHAINNIEKLTTILIQLKQQGENELADMVRVSLTNELKRKNKE